MPHSSDVHSFYFKFEDAYCLKELQDWSNARNNWPILAIALYLLSIQIGKSVMADRKPLHVTSILFFWNASLAAFSLIGFVRLFSHLKHQIHESSFRDSVCINDTDNVVALWVYLFAMSKFVELGDTLFLVVRRRPITFLHWYHHATVLMYTWFAFTHNAATGKYFIIMNYFVHSLMYTYYALQTVRIRVPKSVSMCITSLQILQMIGGITILSISIREIAFGSGCNVHPNTIYSGILMYASYFALFVKFFIRAYIRNQPSERKVLYREGDEVSNSDRSPERDWVTCADQAHSVPDDKRWGTLIVKRRTQQAMDEESISLNSTRFE